MSFTYNKHYLMKDGKPWFPIMGEMHYSRYREDLWEESLRKMKAGGLNIVSAYTIWIHHEEEEGVFDFSGCRDLGKFVKLCRKVGIYMFLRIGPWIHGEVRNGGFPDWLVKQGEEIDLRSDDERYLAYVRRFWEQLYKQVEGEMYKDGGPVIGVQIENEYGHVGGYTGEKGEQHMRTLQAMAKEIGFEVPLYTATGWGGAVIGDCLPVMGGYCEAPWDQSTGELSANTNYVFSQERNDALIACDHHVEGAVTFDEASFPYLTAELGGGLQVTAHRRPVCHGKDIGAMSLTKLGSGVALLGYYMYHGGSNPKGKLSTLQESTATGYLNDLPEINYDFNAPLRQYGSICNSYRELKLLASFLTEWGEDFVTLREEIYPDNVKPEDTHTLRLSDRHDEDHGYIFFNNYQRRREMDTHENVTLVSKAPKGEVTFPTTTIESGAFGFYPYNMKLGDAVLKCATATPAYAIRNGGKTTYVFYGDANPDFVWEGDKTAEILHLSKADALKSWKVTLDGQDYLILSENFVWVEDGKLQIVGGPDTTVTCYPKMENMPGFTCVANAGKFYIYDRHVDVKETTASMTLVSSDENTATYEITVNYGEKADRVAGRDTILDVKYSGFKMDIYAGDEKINDHFFTGQIVPLSLGYLNHPEKLTVVITALYEDTKVFIEDWPEMKEGKACSLDAISIREEVR